MVSSTFIVNTRLMPWRWPFPLRTFCLPTRSGWGYLQRAAATLEVTNLLARAVAAARS